MVDRPSPTSQTQSKTSENKKKEKKKKRKKKEKKSLLKTYCLICLTLTSYLVTFTCSLHLSDSSFIFILCFLY